MQYVPLFILAFLALIAHEAAHAFALNKYGIKAERFGIGLPWPKWLPSFSVPVLGVRVYFHFLLLGAYVAHDDEPVKALSLSDQNIIYAAGVWVNLLCAFGSYAVYALFTGLYWHAFSALSLTLAVLLGRRVFSNILVPILGVAPMALFAGLLAIFIVNRPVLYEYMAQYNIMAASASTANAMFNLPHILLFSAVSLFIGLNNMLPIYPMDGSRIFLNNMEKMRAPKILHVAVRKFGVILNTLTMVLIVGAFGYVFILA